MAKRMGAKTIEPLAQDIELRFHPLLRVIERRAFQAIDP